jgi:site-specific DNA recombinase
VIQATRSRKVREAAPLTVRVAVYTRKSTEEGLDQEFNTLDAQRSAVEAYVTSQRSEGWVALPERYDDGGYTGANIERPAFKRLLADIEAGLVDVVAVYKIDRLSRSMLDFVRLMELFKQHGVTFVSVTQQFSTTNAVGRMTLNLLATFAEFERETISERTRDKVRAARKRGMWTGGRPMLGYDVVGKKLVVNRDEAEQVRAIFALYLETGSLMATVEELRRRGLRAKSWTNQDGRRVHGGAFDKTTLRALLRNPVYVGRMRLGAESFPAAHEAIVEKGTWDDVQAQLTRHGRRGGSDARNKYGLLLRGILACGTCGSSMTGTYSQRNGRRWGFYVCSRVHKQGAAACPGSRVSVGEIEPFVVEKIRDIGRDPALLREAIAAAQREQEAMRPGLEGEARRLESEKRQLASERKNLVDAVAQGGPGSDTLMRRVGDLDEVLVGVEKRLAGTRRELATVHAATIDEDELRAALGSFDPVWDELFPRERARILALLIERVVYTRSTGDVLITFRPSGVASLGRRRETA